MLRFVNAAAAALLALAVSTDVAAAQDFKLYGINYNIRNGPDWAPPAQKCKGAAQIKNELATLKKVTNIVRLYSLTDCDQANAAVPAVIAAGLKLELGLWVGPEKAVFDAERDKFKELIKNTKFINKNTVVSIHVGSEAIYRKDVTADTAISYFKEIKQICKNAKLDVPVSIGDIGDTYLQYQKLFQVVDYVSANMFPFWEKVDAPKAAAYFYERYQKVEQVAKQYKKSVVIGETGWASGGKHDGASVASPANSARYFADFYKLAKQKKLQYYYFAGFDESWKIANAQADSTVEGYFGIFTSDGKLKPELKSLKLDSARKQHKSLAQKPETADSVRVHIRVHRRHPKGSA